MNTKYPLNGRTTTLVDLVHEYGANSFWIENSSYDRYDSNTNKLNSTSVQPFQKLVFNDTLDLNNNYVAKNPYEIVYFNTVYSSTEKDISGKHMKVIQADDSTAFHNYPGSMNLDEYIKAGDVVNATNITKGKYGFKFILASKDKNNQYYYNYKTSFGEATVMYALRNIINILNKYDSTTKLNNLFTKNFANNDDKNEIFNFNDNNYIIGLNENAYRYLGDFIWTYKNVDIQNYTTNDDNLLNVLIKNKFLDKKREVTNTISLFLNKLDDKIIDTSNNSAYNISDNIYKKIEYYLNIFLNSQRFFVSYVTGFRFGKISNKSYLQIDPILRCDLGQLMIYDEIQIINYEHDPNTALPAGPLSLSTSITVNIVYKVKYKNNLHYTNSITYPLIISFQDFKKDITQADAIWYTLRNVTFEDPQIDSSNNNNGYSDYINNKDNLRKIGKYKYESQYFPKFGGTNTYSLKTQKWPLNESLLITDRTKFDAIINKPSILLNNYANTADIETFQINKSEEIDETRNYCERFIKNNNIHPFGVLRIHNVLNDDIETNILNTSFYIDVSLYRCKNYYIKMASNVQDSESANINIYYNPIYNTKYLPEMTVDCINSSIPEESFGNLEKLFKDKNTISKYNNHEYYILLNTNTGDQYEYASGEIANDTNTDISTYTNDLEPSISYLNNSNWVKYKGPNIISATKNQSNLYNTYTLNFQDYDISNTFMTYWKIDFKSINKYFYIKRNSPNNSGTTINISTLYVKDFNQNTPEYILSNAIKNSELSLSFLLYNKNYDNLQIFTVSMINQTINISNIPNELTTLYIEPVNFKIQNTDYNYYYNLLSVPEKNVFYVAYETEIQDSTHYFSFSSLQTLFSKDKNNRVVTLDKIKNNKLNNIYIALNPIYIFTIESTAIKTDDSDVNDNLELFKDISLRYLYTNDNQSLDGPKDNNYICYSISNTILLKHQSITIQNKNLYDYVSDLKSIYNFEFNIIIYQQNKDANTWNKNWKTSGENIITINNNNYNQSYIDSKLNNIGFIGPNSYKIQIELVTLQLKELEVAFYTNPEIYNNDIAIEINTLPEKYSGTVKPGKLGNGSKTSTYNIPYGSNITISAKDIDNTALFDGWQLSWLENGKIYKKDKTCTFTLDENGVQLKNNINSIGICALYKSKEQSPVAPSISVDNNNVTINSNTDDIKISTYYTLNDSDPKDSENKIKYDSTFQLTEDNNGKKIIARNYKSNNSSDFQWSDKAELTFHYIQSQQEN